MVAKTCTKCKKLKLLSMFSKNFWIPGGYHNHCKACRHEYYLQYKQTKSGSITIAKSNDRAKTQRLGGALNRITHDNTKEQYRELAKKKCCKCGKLRPTFFFGKSDKSKDGLKAVCSVCKKRGQK